MKQGSSPRNHWPVKLVMGVRGAAVRHIIMSERAMLQTNRLIPVWRLGVLTTVITMKRLPMIPMMETRPYRTRKVICTCLMKMNSCSV